MSGESMTEPADTHDWLVLLLIDRGESVCHLFLQPFLQPSLPNYLKAQPILLFWAPRHGFLWHYTEGFKLKNPNNKAKAFLFLELARSS